VQAALAQFTWYYSTALIEKVKLTEQWWYAQQIIEYGR
jgi:hypothetical protein